MQHTYILRNVCMYVCMYVITAKDIKELINNEVIPLLKSHANEILILK